MFTADEQRNKINSTLRGESYQFDRSLFKYMPIIQSYFRSSSLMINPSITIVKVCSIFSESFSIKEIVHFPPARRILQVYYTSQQKRTGNKKKIKCIQHESPNLFINKFIIMRSSYKGNPAESDMQGVCSNILKDREDDLETYPSNTFSVNQFSTPIREPTTFKSSQLFRNVSSFSAQTHQKRGDERCGPTKRCSNIPINEIVGLFEQAKQISFISRQVKEREMFIAVKEKAVRKLASTLADMESKVLRDSCRLRQSSLLLLERQGRAKSRRRGRSLRFDEETEEMKKFMKHCRSKKKDSRQREKKRSPEQPQRSSSKGRRVIIYMPYPPQNERIPERQSVVEKPSPMSVSRPPGSHKIEREVQTIQQIDEYPNQPFLNNPSGRSTVNGKRMGRNLSLVQQQSQQDNQAQNYSAQDDQSEISSIYSSQHYTKKAAEIKSSIFTDKFKESISPSDLPEHFARSNHHHRKYRTPLHYHQQQENTGLSMLDLQKTLKSLPIQAHPQPGSEPSSQTDELRVTHLSSALKSNRSNQKILMSSSMVMQRSTNFKNAVKSEEREDSEMSSFGIADSFLNSSNLMLSSPRKNLNRSQHSKISSDMKPATSRRDNRKGVRENILNNSVLNIILDDEN